MRACDLTRIDECSSYLEILDSVAARRLAEELENQRQRLANEHLRTTSDFTESEILKRSSFPFPSLFFCLAICVVFSRVVVFLCLSVHSF